MKRRSHDRERPFEAAARQLREAAPIRKARRMDDCVNAAERAVETRPEATPALARSPVEQRTLAPARSHAAATASNRARPAASVPWPCSTRHSCGPAMRRATAAPIPDPPPVMIETRNQSPRLNETHRTTICRVESMR